MSSYKALESNTLSKVTIINRRKAIDSILFEIEVKNKSVKKIIEGVYQSSLSMIEAQNKIEASSVSVCEIYKILEESYSKGYLPVALAVIIKNNMKSIVIKKSGEEMLISAHLIESMDESPELYDIIRCKNVDKYEKYSEIFNCKDFNTNVFDSVLKGIQKWLFSLSKYTLCVKRIYKGQGVYSELSSEIIKFRESLKGIQKNPYWYLTENLKLIFDNNDIMFENVKRAKRIIDAIIPQLILTLTDDIKLIFSGSINSWYKKLSKEIKTKIHEDKEEEFLKICNDNSMSPSYQTESICRLLTGLDVNNWNDDTPEFFYSELIKIKNEIENSTDEVSGQRVELVLYDENGETNVKIFNIANDKLNNKSELFVKDLEGLFQEYGYSLSRKQKIAYVLKSLVW